MNFSNRDNQNIKSHHGMDVRIQKEINLEPIMFVTSVRDKDKKEKKSQKRFEAHSLPVDITPIWF